MIGYLDCSTGISGDKFLGALIDAGFSSDALRAGLEPLQLAQAVTIVARRSDGIVGTGIDVDAVTSARLRTWAGIRSMLEEADIPSRVRAHALSALGRLASAEATVHGVAPNDVHFHEIGAADTIVDVLGVALGIDALGVDELVASPVAVGSGSVVTEHGELPVPAPATALLLTGVAIESGVAAGELTTPTGAALVREFVSAFGGIPPMVLRGVGTGVGTREIGRPNVARLLLGDPVARTCPVGSEEIVVLESNIDHISPEHAAHAAARMLEAGALDAWQTPIVMKKGRAALVLSVLAAPGDAPALASLLMAETGTLGVRVDPSVRYVVPRESVTLDTTFGPVRFKRWRDARGEHVRAEYDDVSRIARERGIPAMHVAETLETQAETLLGS
ncbi:MAG: nickel pincer cofactor biosynthesis protein LarC [Actinomycetia bacterium]|nr:nickel pincer cofactor biosynthesis protein LarC [Actinomycetes bacterium]